MESIKVVSDHLLFWYFDIVCLTSTLEGPGNGKSDVGKVRYLWSCEGRLFGRGYLFCIHLTLPFHSSPFHSSGARHSSDFTSRSSEIKSVNGLVLVKQDASDIKSIH